MSTPKEGDKLIASLQKAGHQAYYVGGCVRDSILGREPKDWDITTSATPDEVKALFEHVVPTGEKHGTVTVVMPTDVIDSYEDFEVTTFREDGDYSDGRHPDSVAFVKDIRADLARRDYTVNAIACNPSDHTFIDPFDGMKHLAERKLYAVGKPEDRFNEDALRMLRGIRFAYQLDFDIDSKILFDMKKCRNLITNVSQERIRDELCKMLMTSDPEGAMGSLVLVGLMELIIPELDRCFGFDQQNPHHNKDVGDHILAVVNATPRDLKTRLAALFHDIGKPDTFTIQEVDGKPRGRFFGHQTVGADMTRVIMERLKFPGQITDEVVALVKDHMSRVTELRPKNLKRLINRVGDHNMRALFDLMRADVLGHKPPFFYGDLDDMEAEYERIKTEKPPMSLKDMALNGDDLIAAGFKPGPTIGNLLKICYEVILDEPLKNQKEYLLGYALAQTVPMEAINHENR